MELRIESAETEIKQLKKLMVQGPKDITDINYSREPSESIVHIPLDRLIGRMERIENTLVVLKEILEEKMKYKERIENVLKEFDGIQYKVMYLKLKENMTAEKIAEKLWYSERHIRRILKQCKKSTW